MDTDRFDALSRALSTGHSRRTLSRLLGGLTLGGGFTSLMVEPAAAAKFNGGARCTANAECKTNRCLNPNQCNCTRTSCTCTCACDKASDPPIRCVKPETLGVCQKVACTTTGRCVIRNKKNDVTCPDGTCQDGTCTPPVCGNGLCETGAGEDCQTCAADCPCLVTGQTCDPDRGCVCPGSQVECGGSCVTVGESCTTGNLGICATGTLQCDATGSGLVCVGDWQPGEQDEICGNGLDDDCDGFTDEADCV